MKDGIFRYQLRDFERALRFVPGAVSVMPFGLISRGAVRNFEQALLDQKNALVLTKSYPQENEPIGRKPSCSVCTTATKSHIRDYSPQNAAILPHSGLPHFCATAGGGDQK